MSMPYLQFPVYEFALYVWLCTSGCCANASAAISLRRHRGAASPPPMPLMPRPVRRLSCKAGLILSETNLYRLGSRKKATFTAPMFITDDS